ncbi:NADH:ubiquinone oxidoreductase [candidate division TA06 bacterium]|uniref:NADH:ubiquinone oxidoreductase n=1 Tax=candidate division TA06 bacterium TaxID=2250710 RepID=A0A523UVE8_UNCT6|nr:MAG: NADH:ubiquinone oxidoreductase [candidate division TA06 bacterium]
MEKKKIGIYSYTGCSGEQFVILECGAELFELCDRAEIKSFPMAQSNNEYTTLDIAFLEGSITTKKQKKELAQVRSRSKLLVAMGTCACFGGIQSMRLGEGEWKKRFQKVYGDDGKSFRTMEPFESKPCDAFVKIDYYIPGCPMDKKQFLHSVARMLNGNSPYLYQFPVCAECKWKENDCLLLRGLPCLGPLTRGGCGAACPSYNLPCVGCWGPAEVPNVPSQYELLVEKGYGPQEIQQKFRKFGGAPMVERLKKIMEHME